MNKNPKRIVIFNCYRALLPELRSMLLPVSVKNWDGGVFYKKS